MPHEADQKSGKSVRQNLQGKHRSRNTESHAKRIEETTDTDFSLQRYFNQLRVLAQLRKLESKLKDIVMDSIAKYIDEKRDVAYLIGQDKAREQEQTKFVTNLLEKLSLTVEQIADITGVSVEFVRNIKQKLTADQ